MIKIFQCEFYRIRKSRLYFACLFISAFFILGLALTYNYDEVRVLINTGQQVTPSLDKYTEFLFSDYSLIYPLSIFLIYYFTEDYKKGIHALLLSKGASRFDVHFGKLLASLCGTIIYLMINFSLAYFFIISLWAKLPQYEFSLSAIVGFLCLQSLCFIGYTIIIWFLSNVFRNCDLTMLITAVLLAVLYLQLGKLSNALGLNNMFNADNFLYSCWIVGLSHEMEIGTYTNQISFIICVVISYIIFPTGLSYYFFKKKDLRKLERR